MLIGLQGLAGSGKDTLADYLVWEYGATKAAFAQPLRDGVQAMFGFDPALWADRAWKERPLDWLGRSPRELLQTLGTDWGRTHVNRDVWLLVAGQRYAAHLAECPEALYVLTDVRFDNEVEFILDRGGKFVHIERPGIAAVAAHISERGIRAELLAKAITVVNDASIATFLERAERALEI
jgi:hypothetical protein